MLWTSLCYFLVRYAFDQWLRPSYKINGTGYVRSSPILTATWWHSQHSKDAFLTWDVQISLDLWTSKHKHICNNTPNPLSTLYVNVLYLHRKLLFMGSRCLFFSPKNLDYRPLVDSFRLPSSFGTNSSFVLNCDSNRHWYSFQISCNYACSLFFLIFLAQNISRNTNHVGLQVQTCLASLNNSLRYDENYCGVYKIVRHPTPLHSPYPNYLRRSTR